MFLIQKIKKVHPMSCSSTLQLFEIELPWSFLSCSQFLKVVGFELLLAWCYCFVCMYVSRSFFQRVWHRLKCRKKDRHEFSFWRRVKIITQHGAMVLQHVLLQCSRKSVIKCVSKRLCDAFCYKSHWPQLKNVLKIPQEQD